MLDVNDSNKMDRAASTDRCAFTYRAKHFEHQQLGVDFQYDHVLLHNDAENLPNKSIGRLSCRAILQDSAGTILPAATSPAQRGQQQQV
jgi:hypothetical protein